MPVPTRPLLTLSLLAIGVVAQGPRVPDRKDLRRAREAEVGRIEASEAPRIDGRLDEVCWRLAPAIGKLVMVEPWEGREPSQPTVVKLLHDRNCFYIGIYCYDDQPTGLRGTQRARDARLDPDDRVEILLDPFLNRRTAYFFQIGAGGSLGDALVSANGTKFDKPWDTIWDGAARIGDDGWFAEIAIPFRSLPRQAGNGTWGFNLRRHLRTRNEEYQWSNPVQSVRFFKPSELGTIYGFGEIDSGIGLELVPYLTMGASRDRATDKDWDYDPDAGGELYYRITPSMTLAVTALTDFAETEDDSRRINFNRFPLFFPEKRDFFLQGAGYFAFGASSAGGTRFLPFFSRRIGLDGSGNKVPLLGGVKLTGEAGPFEIGLLNVETDRTDTVDRANLGVVRLKYALGEQTAVGLLGTNGEPAGTGTNRVLGVDFYHRWPQFVGDMDLELSLDVVGSTGDDTADDGESFGVQFVGRGSEWEFNGGSRWVSEDYDPALGYVVRRGTRASALEVEYSPRMAEGSLIRSLQFGAEVERSETWSGDTQEQEHKLDLLGARFHSGEYFKIYVSRDYEFVDSNFTLFNGTSTILAGDYWTTRWGAMVKTSQARPWDCGAYAGTGDFFGGTRDTWGADLRWRVSPLLHLGAEYDFSEVDLGPGQSFDAHIVEGRTDLHFTPKLSLYNLVQFDSESEDLGWQSRLRWIYSPGSDFFAVLGTSWEREVDGSFVPGEQSLQLKVSHSIRF